MTEAATQSGWLRERERGSSFLWRFTKGLASLLGRRGLRPLVAVVALWYRLFDRSAVRASKGWLRRVHGRDPSFLDVYRHIRAFAQVTVDRLFLMSGNLDPFHFERNGNHHLQEQVASGRGALLFGAHIGSYEALRASGMHEAVPIKILGYFKNAERVNQMMDELDPTQSTRVIHIGDDPISATVQAKAAIENGELVAIHGDRVGVDGGNTVTAEFFGEPAQFPAGPFLLASVIRCPVFLSFGLYREPNEYHLFCIPFADRLEIPRKDREKGLADVVQRYASAVEDVARREPNNWFNFFDFWSKG